MKKFIFSALFLMATVSISAVANTQTAQQKKVDKKECCQKARKMDAKCSNAKCDKSKCSNCKTGKKCTKPCNKGKKAPAKKH